MPAEGFSQAEQPSSHSDIDNEMDAYLGLPLILANQKSFCDVAASCFRNS